MKKRVKLCPSCKIKLVRYSGEHDSGYECPKCVYIEIEYYAEKRTLSKKLFGRVDL